MAKKWYIIRGPGEKRWVAYEIPPSALKRLKDGCEWRGPYTSLAGALIGANEDSSKPKSND